MPVKIMKASNVLSLETQVNDFLVEKPNPVDIKYSICYHGKTGSSQVAIFSAMLIYK